MIYIAPISKIESEALNDVWHPLLDIPPQTFPSRLALL